MTANSSDNSISKASPMVFITPNLSEYSSFDELLGDKKYDGNFSFFNDKHNFSINNFFHNGSYFIVGEPGSGKSTLIDHISTIAKEKSLITHKILLTALSPTELKTTLTEVYLEKSQNSLIFSQENYIFCLDGLDEVNSNLFASMIDEIIKFNSELPEFKFIVACRTHYLSKNLPIIRRAKNFKFIKIQPFTDSQISTFITKRSGEESAKKFADKTKYYNQDLSSILRVPRYLDIQLKLAADPSREFDLMKRADFFEKFIYQKLERDNGKNEKNILTKRVLEKLALIMEIYQVNKISKDELITFLDQTNSNINLIFLTSESIEKFIERVLKSTEDVLEFDNTEFQEYLAAKELLRLGQKSQILFDLIIEPNFKQIFPNWFDVLKYVVEIDPSQLVNIMEFLKHRIDKLISEDIFTLLTQVDIDKLSKIEKTKVFDIVYNYYQKHELFIWKYAEVLAEFYTDENEAFFDVTLTGSYSIRFSNELYILSHIVENKSFKPVDNLIVNVKNKISTELNKDLLNQYFSLLKNSRSWLALLDLKVVSKKSKDIFKIYIQAIFHVNPNHEFSTELIFEAIDLELEDAIRYFNMVTEPVLIRQILIKINNDYSVLEKLIEKKDNYYPFETYAIFEVIKKVWDSEFHSLLSDQLAHLLKEGNEYELRTNDYFKNLVALLEQMDSKFLETFLKLAEPSMYFSFFDIIIKLINESNVDYLKGLSTKPFGGNVLFNVFKSIKTSNTELYAKIRLFLREESVEIFTAVEAYIQGVSPNEDEMTLRLFHNQLEEDSFYVFETLIKNKKLILSRADGKDLAKLKSIIFNVFNKTTPDQLKITVTNDSGSGRSYNMSNYFVYEYATYLEAGLILGLRDELLSYRENFVKLLPVFEHSNSEKVVFDFVEPITESDTRILTDYFKDRKDDLIRVFATSFVKTVTDYKIKALLPVVRLLLKNPTTYSYEKTAALKCIGEVGENIEELRELFAHYCSDENKNIELAEVSNEYLITKHVDRKAVSWRFDQLKTRKFPFKRSHASGMRPYSDKERELDHLSFAKALFSISNKELIDDFNDLLKFSFEIRKNELYEEYSNYLQQIIYNFYLGLKSEGSLAPLKQLLLMFNNNNSQYKNSFKRLLKDLEIEYSGTVLKPNNIFECVNKYNDLKAKDYLPISNDFDLRNIIMEIIEDDLNNFVANEGFYKPMQVLKLNEDMMQKILKIQIENALNKRGFRAHDVYREPQLHSDRRPDFIVSYGFVGPVVVELKFISNSEVTNSKKRAAYKNKLENNYRRGFNAKYGIYLVLEKENKDNRTLRNQLLTEYSDLKEWNVTFLKCYSETSKPVKKPIKKALKKPTKKTQKNTAKKKQKTKIINKLKT